MEQKISEIKNMLQAASLKELPAFISTYEQDERSGVVSLVNKAKKQIADYEKEVARTEKMKLYEKKYSDFSYICGIDEVGRGPLAGPVVASAVILPKDCNILYINDSKKLSEKKPTKKYSIAGKCCESGDIIAEDCLLPEIQKGDLIAVLSTGAYNYSMSSNYNRNLVPPVVMVKDGEARYAVKPQTFEDLVRNDI